MVSFSNCKINIGLHITEKRQDGYHNIETIFYPIPLFDVIEMVESDSIGLTIHGLNIPGKKEDNIILKAYNLLKTDFNEISPVHLHLLKNIPAGAGLGAGSANGAYALQLLNKYFQLGLNERALLNYAIRLGSDCPFFIKSTPMLARGRGEDFEVIHLDLSAYNLVIVNPGIHVSTQWAFDNINPQASQYNLKEIVSEPVTEWGNFTHNDFESSIISTYPVIGDIKQGLYKQGASYASMSGSGSTVYGLFKKDEKIEIAFPKEYFTKVVPL